MSQGGDLNERTVYVRDLDERVTEPLLHELFIQVYFCDRIFYGIKNQ
jgi:hypothetical protein